MKEKKYTKECADAVIKSLGKYFITAFSYFKDTIDHTRKWENQEFLVC
jgi:hypothetical protein